MSEMQFYGKHCAEMALKSPFVKILAVDCTGSVAEQIPLLQKKNSFPVSIRDISYFKVDFKHQGIAIKAHLEIFKHIEECDYAAWKTVLVLDHLNDPMNVGSAIRHAVAFGVDAIVIPKHQAAPISAAVAHASAGALFSIPVIQPGSFGQCLDSLKKLGFGLIGTTLSERSESFDPKYFWEKSALVIGHEGQGLSQGVAQKCDTLVTIPMSGKIQSLNAAVTASLMCYERFKQQNRNS